MGWYYEVQSLGINYRLTDMQAALASSQLDKLDRFVELRREYAACYDEAFSQSGLIKAPFHKDSQQSSWHLYVIQLGGETYILKIEKRG